MAEQSSLEQAMNKIVGAPPATTVSVTNPGTPYDPMAQQNAELAALKTQTAAMAAGLNPASAPAPDPWPGLANVPKYDYTGGGGSAANMTRDDFTRNYLRDFQLSADRSLQNFQAQQRSMGDQLARGVPWYAVTARPVTLRPTSWSPIRDKAGQVTNMRYVSYGAPQDYTP